MTEKKRVNVMENRKCAKCDKEIAAGDVAVKERIVTEKQEKGQASKHKTIYRHVKCGAARSS